ncbi:MAG: nucleotidyltransferase domain-containing protein [Nanoarchaeota archaeon]|nr:nucleotidyltransferase domain-containing protein [Nanoarchaeota archaeon]
MVQTTTKNLKIIKDYFKKLKKINVERVIFFGSRAKGNFHNDSDFDLIIVSKKFENLRQDHRVLLSYKLWKNDFALELLCYTPKEFKERKTGLNIVSEAIKTGIEIK